MFITASALQQVVWHGGVARVHLQIVTLHQSLSRETNHVSREIPHVRTHHFSSLVYSFLSSLEAGGRLQPRTLTIFVYFCKRYRRHHFKRSHGRHVAVIDCLETENTRMSLPAMALK
jgi:hypothetical protein